MGVPAPVMTLGSRDRPTLAAGPSEQLGLGEFGRRTPGNTSGKTAPTAIRRTTPSPRPGRKPLVTAVRPWRPFHSQLRETPVCVGTLAPVMESAKSARRPRRRYLRQLLRRMSGGFGLTRGLANLSPLAIRHGVAGPDEPLPARLGRVGFPRLAPDVPRSDAMSSNNGGTWALPPTTSG